MNPKPDVDDQRTVNPQPPSASENGAGLLIEPPAREQPRRRERNRPKGEKAARARAYALLEPLGGQNAPSHKRILAYTTGRLIVHFENASNRLMREGELTKDGEPKALLLRVEALAKLIRENIALLAGDDSSDPLSSLLGGGR